MDSSPTTKRKVSHPTVYCKLSNQLLPPPHAAPSLQGSSIGTSALTRSLSLFSFFLLLLFSLFLFFSFYLSFVCSFSFSVVRRSCSFAFVRSFFRLFIRSFVLLSVRSFVSVFVFSLFVCSFFRPFVRLFVCLFVRSSVRSFVLSFVLLFIRSFLSSFFRCSFVHLCFFSSFFLSFFFTFLLSLLLLLWPRIEFQIWRLSWPEFFVTRLTRYLSVKIIFENNCTNWRHNKIVHDFSTQVNFLQEDSSMSLSSLSALDGVKQEVKFNNISLDMIYCIRIVCWHFWRLINVFFWGESHLCQYAPYILANICEKKWKEKRRRMRSKRREKKECVQIWSRHLTALGLRVDAVSDRSSHSGAKNEGVLGRVATRSKLSSFFHSSDTIALGFTNWRPGTGYHLNISLGF